MVIFIVFDILYMRNQSLTEPPLTTVFLINCLVDVTVGCPNRFFCVLGAGGGGGGLGCLVFHSLVKGLSSFCECFNLVGVLSFVRSGLGE